MADSKITELTEATTIAGTDLLPIVADPSGTPVTKKATLNNLLAGNSVNLLNNGNFINNSINGYGSTPDDWSNSSANPVQGGFPSFTKQQLIDITGIADGDIEGLWNLTEASGNATDLSSNSYTLTDTNTVGSSDDGLLGKARDFESSSSEYLTIAHGSSSNLTLTGSRTVFGYVKCESLDGIVAGKRDASSVGYFLYINNAGIVDFTISGLTTNTSITSDIKLETGKWYFICGVYDATNTKLKVWVNGIKKETTASGTSTNPTTAFNVGCINQGVSNAASNFFDGLIQNVGVLSVALTDDQIRRLWAFTTYKGLKIRRATTNAVVSQVLPQDMVERFRGKTLTLRASIYQDVASTATISIDDGSATSSSTTSTTGSWVDVRVTKTISSTATSITIKLNHGTSDGSTWIKEVALFEGNIAYSYNHSRYDWSNFPFLLRMSPFDIATGYKNNGSVAVIETDQATAFSGANNTNEQEITTLRTIIPYIAGRHNVKIRLQMYVNTVAGNNDIRIRSGTNSTYLSNTARTTLYVAGAKTVESLNGEVTISNQDLTEQYYVVISAQNSTTLNGFTTSVSGSRTAVIVEIY